MRAEGGWAALTDEPLCLAAAQTEPSVFRFCLRLPNHRHGLTVADVGWPRTADAAVRLVGAHAFVGCSQQRFVGHAVVWMDGGTGAGADANGRAASLNRNRFDTLLQFAALELRDFRRTVSQQHDELIARKKRTQVSGRNESEQCGTIPAQHLVADRVAVRVVDLF